MGKSLVIKGADFSTNGIAVYQDIWYITLGTDEISDIGPTPTNNSGSAAWSFSDANNALIQGKKVNQIRFVPADTGNFYIFLLNSRTASLGDAVATIEVKTADVGNLTRYEFPEINVGANQYLVFIDPSQAVRMYYAINRTGESFYKRCGFNDAAVVSNYQLLIDVGYRDVSE